LYLAHSLQFGADSDSAFRRRKQAVVFERGATHKATFSTNKVGYKDSDIWEGVVDDGEPGVEQR